MSEECGKLLINKKKSWKPDPISRLHENKLAFDADYAKFLRLNPDINHLRFYWNESIEFEILNDEVDCSWPYPEELNSSSLDTVNISFKEKFRRGYLDFRRYVLSQNSRNNSIDLSSLFKCVDCGSNDISKIDSSIKCNCCSREYRYKSGVHYMMPSYTEGFSRGVKSSN